jgi:predicted nucleotidyltransferase
MPIISSSSVRVFYPKFSKDDLIQRIKDKIEILDRKLPLILVSLFGSYAKGNYTVASDIDLMVIYEGKPRKEAYSIVKKTLSLPLLEPHVYSEDEYKELGGTINRMIKDGIIIYQDKMP